MNCTNCGGRLEGDLTICPFCQSRQDIDLSQVHYRNLGPQGSLPCPGCEATLEVLEFETEPAIQIERCGSCHGMFFNPGELEALLDAKVAGTVWVDQQRLGEIASNFGNNHRVVYRQCPICRDRMSHLNFGGRSGVILDRCWTHGVWIEAGELRRIKEWWRAGGKHLHQKHELEKLETSRAPMQWSALPTESAAERSMPWGESSSGSKWETATMIGAVLGGIASVFFD